MGGKGATQEEEKGEFAVCVFSSCFLLAKNSSSRGAVGSLGKRVILSSSSPPAETERLHPLSSPVDSPIRAVSPPRAFRQRSAAQLNPYAVEQARYARELQKNGWRNAILRPAKVVEESAEELARRKQLATLNPKDDLDGWLEYEQDQRIGINGNGTQIRAGEGSSQEITGDELLRRIAERKEAMQNGSSAGTQAERDAMDRDLEALFGRRKPRQSEYVDDSDDRESGEHPLCQNSTYKPKIVGLF